MTAQKMTDLHEIADEILGLKAQEQSEPARVDALASARRDALEAAARIVERRAEKRVHSTCSYDGETGAWEYPKHAEDTGHALDEEADDCAKEIRALKERTL